MKPKRFILMLVVPVVAFSAVAALVLFAQSMKAHAQATLPPPPELGEFVVEPADGVARVQAEGDTCTNDCLKWTVTYTDPAGISDLVFTWDWGDGATTNCPPISADCLIDDQYVSTGQVEGTHAYRDAGVYSVQLEVRDQYGQFDTATYEYAVAYDPSAGFVTGGGWIDSLAEACPDFCGGLAGKANFGFVSRYKNGASHPTGSTEFQFKMADLNFHSQNYDWLVISGHRAQYKGTGTINGSGSYGFILTAIDADLTPSTDQDRFRIKIWDQGTGVVIYDNQMGDSDSADPSTAISGGSIMIHKAKNK